MPNVTLLGPEDSCCLRHEWHHLTNRLLRPALSVVEEFDIFYSYCSNLILTCYSNQFSAFSALTLLVGWQEGHPACKKLSGDVLVWLSVWNKVQTCTCPADATATHYLLIQ